MTIQKPDTKAPGESNGNAHVDVAAFKSIMSRFPSGVAVVTTTNRDGEPSGFTCSSLCSLSIAPPLVLLCVRSTSASLAVIRERSLFAVNLLHHRGQHAAEIFSGPVPDRFAHVRWRATPDHGLPFLVDDAHAVMECRLAATHVAGDHTILVGSPMRIVEMVERSVPLMYGLRRYAAWPEEKPMSRS